MTEQQLRDRLVLIRDQNLQYGALTSRAAVSLRREVQDFRELVLDVEREGIEPSDELLGKVTRRLMQEAC